MKAGILKEKDDSRVALLPENIKKLSGDHVEVMVEKDAGAGAFFPDHAYEEAGAGIFLRKRVLKEADLLIQINPLTDEEFRALKKTTVVITMLNPLAHAERVRMLSDLGLTVFSLDMIPRITRAQAMDVLSSMATIAGYKAVLDAANQLPKFFPMFMSAAGTIKPAKVLVLGAGVAGLQAVAVARKLGAVVEVFDVRSEVREQVQSLGGKFIEVEGAREDAAAGGYAVEQTKEYEEKQRQLIHDHVSRSDVVITTAQIPGKKAPVLVTRAAVEAMAPGSVIVDLAASSGGNCELTQNNKTVIHNQVTIIGKSNYPAGMPSDASRMLARNLMNLLQLMITKEGVLQPDFNDEIIRGACVTHQNEILNERLKSLIK